jgi:multiple sugar transport system substrate-binding protein
LVSGIDRAEFLRRAGAVAVTGALAGPLGYSRRGQKTTLSIVQWAHVVPAYDAWFDDWAGSWGDANSVDVNVDHVDYTTLPALAAKEAKAQKGHDVFGFLSPPAAYEDQVIDHSSVVSQIESQVGPYGDLGRRSTFNPRTKAHFGVSDSFVPAPLVWRHDLWNDVGVPPSTWNQVRGAAPQLKAAGHPIGIGQSNELDSNTALTAFMLCFGARIQDESGALAIDSPRTVEAVRFMADLYTAGEDDEIFGWNPASNNVFLLSGKGSMIMNAVSVVNTADELGLPFVDDLRIWPIPRGPGGRIGLPQYTSVYSIWRFSKNVEIAQRFLADLCAGYRQATLASSLFNFPSFPGAFPTKEIYQAAAADTAHPRGNASLLTSVATRYTRNLGYPGYANAAVTEVMDRHLIPQMFAQASRGKLSPAESVRSTAKQMKEIWARWKAAGKL